MRISGPALLSISFLISSAQFVSAADRVTSRDAPAATVTVTDPMFDAERRPDKPTIALSSVQQPKLTTEKAPPATDTLSGTWLWKFTSDTSSWFYAPVCHIAPPTGQVITGQFVDEVFLYDWKGRLAANGTARGYCLQSYAGVLPVGIGWISLAPSESSQAFSGHFFVTGLAGTASGPIEGRPPVFGDDNPRVSGDSIAWTRSTLKTDTLFASYSYDTYFYDGQTVANLSEAFGDDYNIHPNISGNNVVWRAGGYDATIFLHDGTSVTAIAEGVNGDAIYPQISGRRVVWLGYDGNDNEVYYFDGASVIQLTDNSVSDDFPQISGSNVAWAGFDGNDYEIFFFNGTVITQLTDNSENDGAPDIDGNLAVWAAGTKLSYYDGTTVNVTEQGSKLADAGSPKISGNLVVWEGFDGNDYEIYLFNASNQSTTQLTNNSGDDRWPQISGNTIVWSGFDGTDYEIYKFNGESTTQLTSNGLYDVLPQISGNNIVWSAHDGVDTEIFRFDGTEVMQITNDP